MVSHTSDAPSPLLLDTAFVSRPVNTYIFMPFLIARLEEHPRARERTLAHQVKLHNVETSGARTVPLTLAWTDAVVPPVPLAAQTEYITDAAACGLTFAVLAHFASATLMDVATRGDRFDYVVSHSGVLHGVEVSGSQAQEEAVLRDRHAQKIRQLLDNPHRLGGYVVIVGFARREVILSYHEARGVIDS